MSGDRWNILLCEIEYYMPISPFHAGIGVHNTITDVSNRTIILYTCVWLDGWDTQYISRLIPSLIS